MKFSLAATSIAIAPQDIVAIPVFEGGRPQSAGFAAVDKLLEKSLSEAISRDGFKGKSGEVRLIHTQGLMKANYVGLYGLGSHSEFSIEVQRKAGGQLGRAAARVKARSLAIELPGKGSAEALAQAILEGLELGSYSFDRYRSKSEPALLTDVIMHHAKKGRGLSEALVVGKVVAEATNFARELINTPANDMTPREIVRQAKLMVAATQGRLKLETFGRDKAKQLGMNAFLAVARGSVEPPAFLHLTYLPAGKSKGRVAIVGKGITFDSGGLSLKPPQAMETMKYDMAGAGVVLAVMQAVGALRPAVEVHGFIASTENMPSGSAGKPGDVVKAMSGKTIEILNTDAEGRLVLADALAYAQRYKPEAIIDVATLTGACVVALGELCAGIMGNDKALVDRIIRSGTRTGEKIWPLPLYEEYKDDIKGLIADIKNTGGRYAGTITAGLFLQEFIHKGTPWAHIDMAGPSWTDKDLDYSPKGATGAMVRTLVDFIVEYS